MKLKKFKRVDGHGDMFQVLVNLDNITRVEGDPARLDSNLPFDTVFITTTDGTTTRVVGSLESLFPNKTV